MVFFGVFFLFFFFLGGGGVLHRCGDIFSINFAKDCDISIG